MGIYFLHQSDLVSQRDGLVNGYGTIVFIRKRTVHPGNTVALVTGLNGMSIPEVDTVISEPAGG